MKLFKLGYLAIAFSAAACAASADDSASSANDLSAAATPVAIAEVEPNDDLASANQLPSVDSVAEGTIASSNDVDYWTITLAPGVQTWGWEIEVDTHGLQLDAIYEGQTIPMYRSGTDIPPAFPRGTMTSGKPIVFKWSATAPIAHPIKYRLTQTFTNRHPTPVPGDASAP